MDAQIRGMYPQTTNFNRIECTNETSIFVNQSDDDFLAKLEADKTRALKFFKVTKS